MADKEKKTVKSALIRGTVLAVSGDKVLVLVDGRKYYIIKGKDHSEGDTVEFDEKKSLPMPSYMFAIAAMAEPDLDSTLGEIKERWFGDWNK